MKNTIIIILMLISLVSFGQTFEIKDNNSTIIFKIDSSTFYGDIALMINHITGNKYTGVVEYRITGYNKESIFINARESSFLIDSEKELNLVFPINSTIRLIDGFSKRNPKWIDLKIIPNETTISIEIIKKYKQ